MVTLWCPGLLSLLQISGDLEDLELALNKTKTKHTLGSGSCSALIKLLPGHSDLLVAHNTWNSYQSMLRVIKNYWFQFHEGPQGGWMWMSLCVSMVMGTWGGGWRKAAKRCGPWLWTYRGHCRAILRAHLIFNMLILS